MSTSHLGGVLRHLRHWAGEQSSQDLTDGQLLERFTARREETAFAILVQRHGPMVLGLCRRVLHDAHDAEDAFQATFLVLARRAASIRNQESVASWLYGVAHRVAAKARSRAVRRRSHERFNAAMPRPEPLDAVTWQELRAVLDDELARLPDKYRAAVLLCHLQGKTLEQAAQELGCPKSTLSSRLGRARELLGRRLAQRGIALSTGVLAAILAEKAPAAVPAVLMIATVHAAHLAAAGKALGATAVSPQAAAWAEGVVKAMSATKLKLVTSVALAIGLLGTGAGVLTFNALASDPPEAPPAQQVEDLKRTPVDADGNPLPAGAVARLGHSSMRQGGDVMHVVYSPNGKLLASAGGRGGLVKLWDLATGRLVHDLRGHADFDVRSLAFSPDGTRLVSGGSDWTVRLWDVATGKQTHLLRAHLYGHHGLVLPRRVAFSPDGRSVIAGAHDGVIEIWDVTTGKQTKQLRPDGPPPNRDNNLHITALAVSPDGKRVAVFNYAKKLLVYDLTTDQSLALPALCEWVRDLKFLADGKSLAWCETRLATREAGEGVRVWDLEANQLRVLNVGNRAGKLAGIGFTPDARFLVTQGPSHAVQLWDLVTGQLLQTFLGHTRDPYTVAFAPDGQSIATGSADGSIRIWDLTSGKERVTRRTGHWEEVLGLAIAPDGQSVLLAGKDRTVRTVGLTDAKLRRSFPVEGPNLEAAAFSTDGSRVALAHGPTVDLWDTTTGKLVWSRNEYRPAEGQAARKEQSPDAVAFSKDGSRVVCASGDRWAPRRHTTLRVWDTATGNLVSQIDRPLHLGGPPVLTADGKTLALSEYALEGEKSITNQGLRLFDTATGKLVKEFTSRDFFGSPALAPDGTIIATGTSNNRIQFWDVATGVLRFTLQGPRAGTSMRRLTFTADGRKIAGVSDHDYELIHVFDVASGRLLHDFAVGATSVAFSPDGRHLLAGQHDGTTLVWDLTSPSAVLPPRPKLTRKEIEARWLERLTGMDTSRGNRGNYDRENALVEGGNDTVAFLEEYLLDPKLVEKEAEWAKRLLAPLADPNLEPQARDQARRAVERFGDEMYHGVKSLGDGPAPEKTLQWMEKQMNELLRYRRGSHGVLDVLRQIGTPRARQLLSKLTEGPDQPLEVRNRRTMAGYYVDELEKLKLRRPE